MKIAIFTDTYYPAQVNGVARVASRQAAVLATLGHEVRVWSVHNTPSVPFPGYAGERMALPALKAYREAVAWQPDVIHTHTPFGLGWEAVLASRRLRVPLVGTHHTFFDHYVKHIGLNTPRVEKFAWRYPTFYYNRADLVFSPSVALLEGMKRAGLTAAGRHFPNSVDTESFKPARIAPTEPVMIYMGRVSYEKSIDKALEAFALVLKRKPEAKLLIAGDGPERKKLQALAEGLNINKSIEWLGMLHGQELVKALQRATLFITASKSENMPVSVIEAMAAGLPVVGVNALGMPEIVKNNVNGFIVPPDDTEAMAEKSLKVLNDAALRDEFRKNSRKLALTYGEKKRGEALVKEYEALLNRPFKICLYLEFLHFRKGAVFKGIGTGLLSSFKNQKKMLEDMGIAYTEKWDGKASILQINTPWLKSLWLMWRARRLKIPIIVWAHVTAEDIRGVFWFGNLVSPIMRKYLAYAYNRADIICAPSDYTKRLLVDYKIRPDKIIAQSNGVDLNKFYPDAKKRAEGRKYLKLKERDFAVGTVALAIPRKGIKTFIALARRFSETKFVWAGTIYSGALAKPLPKHVPENVRFTGFVPDILAVYNAFDAFIFASYEENQGMAILEAAAIGLPIIVRDIPVYEGWLVHGENCLKARSDVEFSECLEELKHNPDLRATLGAHAKKLAQENSLEALSIKLRGIYNKLTQ